MHRLALHAAPPQCRLARPQPARPALCPLALVHRQPVSRPRSVCHAEKRAGQPADEPPWPADGDNGEGLDDESFDPTRFDFDEDELRELMGGGMELDEDLPPLDDDLPLEDFPEDADTQQVSSLADERGEAEEGEETETSGDLSGEQVVEAVRQLIGECVCACVCVCACRLGGEGASWGRACTHTA